jgi:hypothetical protein
MDELHPMFRDFGFLQRAGAEPLVVEVWDRDGDGRELIGRRELAFDGRGVLAPAKGAFADVESIELYAERVPAPEESFTLSYADGELETHLWIAAHQKLSFAVEGRMCWDRVCATGGMPAHGDVGQLLVFHGSDDEPKTTPWKSGLEVVTESAGPLRLYAKPASTGKPSGSYRVTVRQRP